ncbi:MAG TPA: phosphoribosylanthranilate isomerase [Candidatus Cybelea sp.]|nr:phosphoribosylanthranilate isomerase [Candidatus Cybelea sp.]
MSVLAKICGLNTPEAVAAAVTGGADMIGLVFYPPSPRNVTPAQAAALAKSVPTGVDKVGLFVDADDAAIGAAVNAASLDLLQLHGHESPERVAALKRLFKIPAIKAVPLSSAEDLIKAAAFESVADWLLFDAKVPALSKGALPGGNGLAFDWELLAGRKFKRPWLLSGGLNAGNVAEAVRISGAHAVDVSSGVESAPGRKDPARIGAFLDAVHRL